MAFDPYRPIDAYAFLSNGTTSALVSREGSIDWCCMPRVDSASVFGRLLDADRGGFCSLSARHGDLSVSREYVEESLVLATTYQVAGGVARAYDALATTDDEHRGAELLRVLDGVRGQVDFTIKIAPRFDYAQIHPWLRRHGLYTWSAIGGDDGLLIVGDVVLDTDEHDDLAAHFTIHGGQRVRFALRWIAPHELDDDPEAPNPAEIDNRLDATLDWWGRHTRPHERAPIGDDGVRRSATVLMGLTNAATGAIVAAPTTSLPEAVGGIRNWDYRYSWIRDSQFSARSLAQLGYDREADAFRAFVQRSAAGDADAILVCYGVRGNRRIPELTLDHLSGYRDSQPVRIGNSAAEQLQLDVFGYLLDLSWRWHQRGRSPDDDFWRFLLGVVDRAANEWEEPDRGIWETRAEPQHFVHSKAMCWAALDRGVRLADECLRQAPVDKWAHAREAIRRRIDREGYDDDRGVFTRAFGSKELDASLLLLPEYDFVAYDDERMVRTADAIAGELDDHGLIRRYRSHDGLPGREGVFIACTFWLAQYYARVGRMTEATTYFERATATSNDLGLFAEEYDPRSNEALGNFPQALTHLSHISAAVALAQSPGPPRLHERNEP